MKKLCLISNWRSAFRMFSMQAMGIATAIQGSWAVLPEEMKATVPPKLIYGITAVLLVAGMVGRLLHQPELHAPPCEPPQ